jgi:hypothetical protein
MLHDFCTRVSFRVSSSSLAVCILSHDVIFRSEHVTLSLKPSATTSFTNGTRNSGNNSMVDVLPHTLVLTDEHRSAVATIPRRSGRVYTWRHFQQQKQRDPWRNPLAIYILRCGSRVGLRGTYVSSPAIDWLETRHLSFRPDAREVEIWSGHWTLALVYADCCFGIEREREVVGAGGDRSICSGALVCLQLMCWLSRTRSGANVFKAYCFMPRFSSFCERTD